MDKLTIDPQAVRSFSDDVWTELHQTVKPWIARIRADLAGGEDAVEPAGLGAEGADYGGVRLSKAHATNAQHLALWLSELETGLETLSLASAVTAEQLMSDDAAAAWWLEKSPIPPKGIVSNDD